MKGCRSLKYFLYALSVLDSIAADSLATERATKSPNIVVTQFARNTLVSAQGRMQLDHIVLISDENGY